MKNLILKAATAAAMMAMMVSSAVPVYAATTSTAGSNNVTVTATVNPTYTVELPDSITLTGANGNYTGSYTVGAKGNLASSNKVTITPAASFTMTGADSGVTASANVTQAKNTWINTVTDADSQVAIGNADFTTATGSIAVALNKADTYTGTMIFTVAIQ